MDRWGDTKRRTEDLIMKSKEENKAKIHRENLYNKLLEFAEKCSQNTEYANSENTKIWKAFSLDSKAGERFYEALSDEELLDVLRLYAKKLGHSPAQKEVYWIWRTYIKKRFRKWPYALLAAGLSKAAGRDGKTLQQKKIDDKEYEELLEKVREKAKELCRIPHPKDMPDICEALKKYTQTWNQVIEDAKLTQTFLEENVVYNIPNLEEEYKAYLEEIRILSEKLNRAPLKSEIDAVKRKKLVKRCKSWRNTLYQLELEPVIKIKPFSSTYMDYRLGTEKRLHNAVLYDCYYKILNIDDTNTKYLEQLKGWIKKNRRIPDKREFPKEMRQSLQEVCGSWANVLYQIGYEKKNI